MKQSRQNEESSRKYTVEINVEGGKKQCDRREPPESRKVVFEKGLEQNSSEEETNIHEQQDLTRWNRR